MMQKEKLTEGPGFVKLGEKKGKMHLTAVTHNLNKGHRGVTWDTSNRTKASGGQLQEDKVWLNMGIIRVHRKHWDRYP